MPANMHERLAVYIDGSLQVTLYGRGDYYNRNTILTKMDGWRGGDAEVETEPKLFGEGSYIRRIHHPERLVTVGGFVRYNPLDEGYASVNPGVDLVQTIADAMQQGDSVRLDYLYSYDGTTAEYRERLSGGRLTNVQPPIIHAAWQTEIEFTVLFVNPAINFTIL